MNKKRYIIYSILLTFLNTLTLLFHVWKWIHDGIFHLFAWGFTFFSFLFTLGFCLIILRNFLVKKENSSRDYSKFLKNNLTNSFFLLAFSILITFTIFLYVSYFYPDHHFLFLLLPEYIGFVILWIYIELPPKVYGNNAASFNTKYTRKKTDILNLVLIGLDFGFIIFLLFFIVIDFNEVVLSLFIPLYSIFNILWIVRNRIRKKGYKRDKSILITLLIFFGFNCFLSLPLFNEVSVLIEPFLIIGIIYIIFRLVTLRDKTLDDGKIVHKKLLDEHRDIIREINGTNEELG